VFKKSKKMKKPKAAEPEDHDEATAEDQETDESVS